MFRRRLWCVLVFLGCAPACSEAAYVGGTCGGDVLDCRTDHNYGEGTECIEGRCKCPNPAHAEVPCCPGGGLGCAELDFKCRPRAECEPVVAAQDAGSDAPSDAAPPVPEAVKECATATAADDCAKVLGLKVDAECAQFVCVKDRCGIENLVLGPLPHDAPGDCKRFECGILGSLAEVVDVLDAPIDLNPCTFGACKTNGEPQQVALADGVFCPDSDLGICRDGACVECDQLMGVMCGAPLQCDFEWCVPNHCFTNGRDFDESDVNCGGVECRPCDLGQKCNGDGDCLSGSCVEINGAKVCVASTHTDGKWNDSETGVDCGCDEGGCVACPNGQGCALPSDCKSGVCFYGVCRPASCFNGAQDMGEEAVDCGGAMPDLACPPC